MLTFRGSPCWAALLAAAALVWSGRASRGPVYRNPDAPVERRVVRAGGRLLVEVTGRDRVLTALAHREPDRQRSPWSICRRE